MVEESEYFAVVFEEAYHIGIEACKGFVALVFAGVVDSPAIENISAAVAGYVVGNAFFVGEAKYPDGKSFAVELVGKLFHIDQLQQ